MSTWDSIRLPYSKRRRQWRPLQCSCLENPVGGGAWRASPWVAEGRTRLSDFTFMHWRRQWHPLQCSCLENPMDGGAWKASPWVAEGQTRLSDFTFMHWRRQWQPTPVFLPGESQGRGEPGGLPSMGSHRVGHD